MNSLPHSVQKYLEKKSNTTWEIEPLSERTFDNIIVIPALAEIDNIKQLIKSLAENDSKYFHETLILFVINNTVSASDEIKSENKSTINYLKSILFNNNKDYLSGVIQNSKINISYINACTEGYALPDKDGGVGLARKIGMDIALKYFNYKTNTKKILICLDADCTVDKNYIRSIIDYFNLKNCSAAVVNYEHKLKGYGENDAAIICYELYLRYYLMGLTYAGSSYAFHTIGSSMVCDFESYIKIGGMNKLKAAEDFYFLEKLSKITKVHTVKSTCVYPSSRPSFRVPFGTGQRVNRFLSKARDEYLLYNPQSFVALKQWLALLDSLDESNFQDILSKSKSVDLYLYKFLEENKFILFWEKICSQKLSKQQMTNQKKYWFDGFKTLKLIHFLRDNTYPLVNMFDAIDEMLLLSKVPVKIERDKSTLPDLDKQKEYLLLLRKLQNN